VTASPASLTKLKSGAKSPSRTKPTTSSKRAVGVVRVSRVGDRSGEQFVSPTEQAERIRSACTRDGLKLMEVVEELDVSGGASLDRRPGLSRAIELVEEHKADVLVVAFFDRLVRSLRVQTEIVERVEAAGGKILAVDVGQVTNGSAGQWLSGTMLGAVSEYARRVTAERTTDAKRRAVARGVAPYPNVPPGYRRAADGSIEPHPKQARTVAKAFKLRAGGATVMEVRAYLREHGIERSFHGTTSLLASRVVRGELRFGELVNTESHKPIVDEQTWQAVQRMSSPRGRRAKSERLLARLGVLRCATCGARMVVGTANHGAYHLYRCPPVGNCPQRVTIAAEIAERTVTHAVKELLAGMRGTASLDDGIADAEHEFAQAEQELDATVEAFTGLDDVQSARKRLNALREVRDRSRDRLAELQAAALPAVTISASGDWDQLTLDERRALIRAVVERVDVAPGRGSGRLTVKARGE
jgi:site-specific DNA recombinase